MTSSLRPSREILLRTVVKGLAAAAREERSHIPFGSPEWEFYRGVEAATVAVLHPELESAKAPDWLRRETGDFLEGYVAAEAQLAAAVAASTVPSRIALPNRRTAR